MPPSPTQAGRDLCVLELLRLPLLMLLLLLALPHEGRDRYVCSSCGAWLGERTDACC